VQRVRIVSLTPKGKELIALIFSKHAGEIRKVFADASPKELRALATILKNRRRPELRTARDRRSKAQCNSIADLTS
jgi:hypothetical protein